MVHGLGLANTVWNPSECQRQSTYIRILADLVSQRYYCWMFCSSWLSRLALLNCVKQPKKCSLTSLCGRLVQADVHVWRNRNIGQLRRLKLLGIHRWQYFSKHLARLVSSPEWSDKTDVSMQWRPRFCWLSVSRKERPCLHRRQYEALLSLTL